MSEPAAGVRLTMVRCSTLLIEWPGGRVLTDPWFAMRLRGLPCLRRPGLAPDRLGRLDAVLASHLHPDHFERRVVESLRPAPPLVLLPPGALERLRGPHPPAFTELAPWQSVPVAGATVTAVPARHTGPGPDEVNFVLEIPGWGRLFFGGDARFDGPVLQAIARRFAPIRVALLPVGGTRILGVRTVMDPADALAAARLLQARTVLPIHEGGIWLSVPPLSLHPGRARHLAALAERAPGSPEVRVLSEGESLELRRVPYRIDEGSTGDVHTPSAVTTAARS